MPDVRPRERPLLRALLCSAALFAAAPAIARAQSSTPSPEAAKPSISPTLQATPELSALPQSIKNPTKKQDPTAIHQRDWGVFNRDGGSPSGFGPTARYGADYSQEDWSYLRDTSLRRDIFERLKFIPLNDAKTIYLTLSLDERERDWYESRPFLGQQKPIDSGRLTVRGLYGADLHLGDNLRVFGQLVNGDAGGWAGYGYNATYRTRLDAQQLYVEGKMDLFGAKTGVILGRQQFLDAPNYVLYVRDTPNLPLSWNGGRAYAIWPRVRVDAFDFVQTNTTPTGMFQDNFNYRARLYGGYGSYAVPDFTFMGQPGHMFADLFYLGYILNSSTSAIPTTLKTQSGATHRDNYGTRLWGKAGPIEYSVGGLYQGGEFYYPKSTKTRSVDAYSVNTVVGYRLADTKLNTLLALQGDVYSGGNYNATTGSVGTYIAPYNPSTNYLDTTTYLSPSNLIDVAPTLEVTPISAVTAKLKVPLYWRDSTNDAVYGASRIYTFRGKYTGGYVGTIPQLTVAWRINTHLTWTNDFARLFASDSLSHAGAEDGTYYLSTIDFRF